MAAQLTDEGRSPAVQKISAEAFGRFLENCRNAPQPNDNLKALLKSPPKAK